MTDYDDIRTCLYRPADGCAGVIKETEATRIGKSSDIAPIAWLNLIFKYITKDFTQWRIFKRIHMEKERIYLRVAATAALIHCGIVCKAGLPTRETLETDSVEEAEEAVAPLSLDEVSLKFPSIPYHTPEAAAFMKYGAYSVGGYTGRPDISVPVCELTDRDLSIPLTVAYDARGIKVAQEASWVGLGWDMAVGGCINTIVEGNLDYLSRIAPWSRYEELFGRSKEQEFRVNANPVVADIYGDMANGVGEIDFYSAGFLGQSVIFFKNPYTDSYETLCDSTRVYSISRPNNAGWVIKDDQGYEYSFDEVEYTTPSGGPTYESAWYLTSVVSPQGAGAQFIYDTTVVKPLPTAVETYDVERKLTSGSGEAATGLPAPYQTRNYWNEADITQPWLKRIAMRNQTVEFDRSPRSDFLGALRLDGIRVVAPSGSTVSRYHFNYGMFSCCAVGGRCFDTQDEDYITAESTRLKLMSMSQLSMADTDSLTYRFAYNEKYPLPYKTSYARDFWGYYNGAENYWSDNHSTSQRTTIPSVSDCMINCSTIRRPDESTLAMKGAQRFSDRRYITSGSLRRITYPTGGYTEFSLEPHVFASSPAYPLYGEGYSSIGRNIYFSNPAQSNAADHARIDVADRATGTVKLTFSGSGNTKIRDLKRRSARLLFASMSSSQANSVLISLDSCSNVDENASLYSCSRRIELPAGSYMASVSFSTGDGIYPNTGYIRAEISLRDIPADLESGGGGLRVAGIENFDISGASAGKTEFLYENADGTSSGERICGSSPMEAITMYNETGNAYKYNMAALGILRLHSSFTGVKAVTSVQLPGEVGYRRQVENHYDKDGNLRKSVENLYNLKKTVCCLSKFHLMKQPGGGELTVRTTLGAASDTLMKERFFYVTKSDSPVKCNAYSVNNYYNKIVEWTHDEDSVALEYTGRPHYSIYVYSYPRRWRVLDSVIREEYAPGGKISVTTRYSYSRANHLVSDETTEDAVCSLRRHYCYPTDYRSGTYAIMGNEAYHLKGVRVETLSYLKRQGRESETGHTKVDYLYNRNLAMAFKPVNYLASEGGSPLANRMTVKYDNDTGNITETVKDGVERCAVLWSYGNLYPVAIIEGASLADVQAWLGAQFISQLSAATTDVGDRLTALRSGLSGKNVLVTTYEHIPLVGVSKETMPNGDVRQYRYDGFNRLVAVSDADGNELQQYEYVYAGNKSQ